MNDNSFDYQIYSILGRVSSLWYFAESICMNFHNFILWPSLSRPENGISADKLRPGQPRYSWKTKTELCCTSSQPYSRLDSV